MSLLDHTFFSDIYGSTEYELALSAWGEGVLRESDLLDMQKPDEIIREFEEKHRRYPRTISLLIQDPTAVGYDFCYTGVETAFLEKLKTLKELILPSSIEHIEMTPELERILKKNNTLIRGPFDSFAEGFAAEHALRFRPADLVFAEYESAAPPETRKLTLVFTRGGKAHIREDVFAPGTNAGNTSGGSLIHALKRDFYKKQTAGQIAELFDRAMAEEIVGNGRLAEFIEKAKEHGYFGGKI
ncbi:MAG: hypothetical protein J5827_00555 [Oscillospiraceae bacterium]|nr:hypothetical protein [Oscillospiraceae bacterium]